MQVWSVELELDPSWTWIFLLLYECKAFSVGRPHKLHRPNTAKQTHKSEGVQCLVQLKVQTSSDRGRSYKWVITGRDCRRPTQTNYQILNSLNFKLQVLPLRILWTTTVTLTHTRRTHMRAFEFHRNGQGCGDSGLRSSNVCSKCHGWLSDVMFLRRIDDGD